LDMIIGSGVIANRFKDCSLQSKYLIFAGSVNDSSIQDKNIIQAEEKAVTDALSEYNDSTFVYFSSCSILDPEAVHAPYVQHKVNMEKLIQSSAKSFLIFRLPQVMGFLDAKSSLVNFLVEAIGNQKKFELWCNAQKNIIDIDDVYEIVVEVLKRGILTKKIVNIASSHQTSVIQLVNEIEKFLGLNANYILVNKGTSYDLDISAIKPVLSDLNIDFGEAYIQIGLNKYFGHLLTPSQII
jgi:nucleoside-diphosphate-sugar epimerase